MTVDPGFEILPGAAQDILEIWEFIAADNPIAAKRVREEILDTIRTLVSFPHKGTGEPISRCGHCVFKS